MNDRGGRFYECLHQIWDILRNILKTQQQTCLHNYYLFPHPRCEHLLWLCWSLIPKHHHIHNHHLEEICHSNPIVPRKQSQTKDLHSNQFHSASFKDAKNYSLINPTQTSVLYQIIKVIPSQVCYDNGHIYLTVGCDSLIAVVCWTSNISSTRASQAQLCVYSFVMFKADSVIKTIIWLKKVWPTIVLSITKAFFTCLVMISWKVRE